MIMVIVFYNRYNSMLQVAVFALMCSQRDSKEMPVCHICC